MTISELLPRRVKQSSLATNFIPDKMGIGVFYGNGMADI